MAVGCGPRPFGTNRRDLKSRRWRLEGNRRQLGSHRWRAGGEATVVGGQAVAVGRSRTPAEP